MSRIHVKFIGLHTGTFVLM